MELKKRTYSGTRSQEVTEREKQNRLVARMRNQTKPPQKALSC